MLSNEDLKTVLSSKLLERPGFSPRTDDYTKPDIKNPKGQMPISKVADDLSGDLTSML